MKNSGSVSNSTRPSTTKAGRKRKSSVPLVEKEPNINFDALNNKMGRFKENLKMTCSVIIDDIVEHLDSFFNDQRAPNLLQNAQSQIEANIIMPNVLNFHQHLAAHSMNEM